MFIISVVALTVPLFAYFSLHVSSRADYFKDRNFRQLRNSSRQIADSVDNLGSVFSNAVEKFVRPQPDESGGGSRADFQNYFDILKIDGANFTATHIDPIPKLDPDADLTPEVSINVVNEDSTPWLYFDWSLTFPPSGSPNNSVQKSEPRTIHFIAKTDFDQLIEPLINKTGDEGISKDDIGEEFDHIIMARADNGKVLFEQTNDDLSITSLEQIPLADTPEKRLDFKTLSNATDSVDVTIGGARYKLYVQPVRIALATSKDAQNPETLWVICGLVEASRFRSQTWAISYTVLIISGFIAGLLFLSWPFLKLIFIGPKDRLRVAEPYILAISIVIVGALLTFFVLFVVTYRELEHNLDQQLIILANSFQKNFQAEVGNALEEIDKLDARRAESLSSPSPEPAEKPQPHRLRQLKNLGTAEGDGSEAGAGQEFQNIVRTRLLTQMCEQGKCDSQKDPYPYFKTAFWVDDKGQQVAKWTINNQTTKRIPVGTRDYFSKIRSGYYRELNQKRYWLEPVQSKNTGAFTVVISKEAVTDANPKASVVALETNLMSLMKPALADGFGYRVIDANGDVVFPRLKENFFAECNNNYQLRSNVSGHLNDFVSVPYLGKDSQIYVTPIDGLPDWTLVVFRDKEPLRSSYLEIVALSASLFLIYLVPFLVVLAIMFFISLFTGSRLQWMWPSPASAAVYLQSIPINVLLAFIAYKLSYHMQDTNLIVLLTMLSVGAVVLLILQLKYGLALPPFLRLASYLEQHWPLAGYRSSYSLCLVALVFVIAVLPSLAFFRIAYNEEMDLFIKYSQVTLVNSLNEREERVRAAYPIGIFNNRMAADTFIETRLSKDLDRYSGFFFNTEIAENDRNANNSAEETQGKLLLLLSRLVPFSSQSSIIRHGLIRAQTADNLWHWSGGRGEPLTLRAPRGSAKGKVFVNITTTSSHFTLEPFLVFLFLVIIIPILFLLIRFVLSNVFLLDVVKVSKSHPQKTFLSNAQKTFVVLGSPFTQRERLLKHANFKVLNLTTVAIDDQWLEKFDLESFLEKAKSEPIAIDCFEYQIDEPQQNLQKLCLLEKLITHEQALVVTSTAEPADYLFENVDPGSNHARPEDAAVRWARVMSNFWVHYLEDNGDPDAFKTELGEVRSDSHCQAEKTTPTTGKPPKEELITLLIRECAPRACLQDIGREIRRRCDFNESNPDEIVDEVLMQAGTYYKLVWESCSPTEKLSLAHLALDGFLSSNDPDVPLLVRRGLIVRDSEVRLMNESFRLFVLAESRIDNVVALTEGQARKSSNWQYLKVALSVTVVILMVFLFATQRDLYNSTLVAVTSIVAGLPTIFNFFNLFHNNLGGSRSSP